MATEISKEIKKQKQTTIVIHIRQKCIRDRSSITGSGATIREAGGGGTSEDLPLRKGGGESWKGFGHAVGGGGEFPPFKGGAQKVSDQRFSNFLAPPLPIINDQLLNNEC